MKLLSNTFNFQKQTSTFSHERASIVNSKSAYTFLYLDSDDEYETSFVPINELHMYGSLIHKDVMVASAISECNAIYAFCYVKHTSVKLL